MRIEGLYRPFPADLVSWRVGSTNQEKTKGMALAYIDARDVMNRFDEVAGAENWQCRYSHVGAHGVVCEIGLNLDGWVWKANGAGETQVEGQKGALSDAFKRAAVLWGVGRYLYDLKSPWVEIEPFGRSYKIKESEYKKLDKVLRDAGAFDAETVENVKKFTEDSLFLLEGMELDARRKWEQENEEKLRWMYRFFREDEKDLRMKVKGN